MPDVIVPFQRHSVPLGCQAALAPIQSPGTRICSYFETVRKDYVLRVARRRVICQICQLPSHYAVDTHLDPTRSVHRWFHFISPFNPDHFVSSSSCALPSFLSPPSSSLLGRRAPLCSVHCSASSAFAVFTSISIADRRWFPPKGRNSPEPGLSPPRSAPGLPIWIRCHGQPRAEVALAQQGSSRVSSPPRAGSTSEFHLSKLPSSDQRSMDLPSSLSSHGSARSPGFDRGPPDQSRRSMLRTCISQHLQTTNSSDIH
ncbi:hypothetical protein BS47DRAFT_1388542 [Hydnum rufescens UP504]|uniref:Uncharacterized protein n=1 Tax=Hydnum rufescens UP504 TaxID=1448309 RepID=A0A9P6B6W4_9AGAM|nr:hypothetical protein BS47DRAFT_1388542 [Hydnum rufescens UP504]